MSENLRLYQQISQFIEQSGVSFRDVRNLATFVWAIVGLLLSEQIHLSQWALFRPGESRRPVRNDSYRLVTQLQDTTDNHLPQPGGGSPIALARTAVELALDSSLLWNRFVVVRIALIYRGRMPLAWLVLEQGQCQRQF